MRETIFSLHRWTCRARDVRMAAAFLCAFLFAALPMAVQADTLGVAVAANLQFVFADLQAAFEQHSPHRLQPSFASSGKLVSQIMLGAPFDVFLSADMQFPLALEKAGFSATAPAVYARGVLVLWSAQARDLSAWQPLLSTPAIGRIAIANPETAPYGREALRALAFYGLDAGVKPKLVYAESVSQVNQYVHSGSVDAGFTAKSAVSSAAMRSAGSWITVPSGAYRPIDQGVVMTRHGAATHRAAAQAFLDFLRTAPARSILAAGGYAFP
jgi:molybdate transport system substrate-binding protein